MGPAGTGWPATGRARSGSPLRVTAASDGDRRPAAGWPAGTRSAKGRFPGRDLLEAIGSVPIILAPTVLGYYLLQLLGNGADGTVA